MNISDERAALDELLEKLEKEGLGGKTFLSGTDEPNMGDLAVFGALRTTVGLPIHEEAVGKRETIHDWYNRMVDKVDKPSSTS